MTHVSSDELSIAVAGVGGRMGRQLVAAALRCGHRIAGGSEVAASPALDEDIGLLAGRFALGVKPSVDPISAAETARVWIDFTQPAATLAALDALKRTTVQAAIIGTTGFSEEQEKQIASFSERFAIVKAGNFSVGINLLQALTRIASARLGKGWDIEVSETHHRRKVDAPSGTALMLGEAAAEGRGVLLPDVRAEPYDGPDAARVDGEIGFAVRRMGDVIGDHEVSFGSDREIITLSHAALDRSLFAEGAITAVEWAIKQAPGLYGMDDVLGLA